ncbi:MAG: glycerol-3-phosphate ABC transporter ATP-binding protein [Armatimonadetes bacterium JP3_11]|jgi:multiple sugar transport system ATP-binding protein|nr:MAG: glycerol-3-phosphate ABC transporter ATP-binding protein [Armatimonadetes bacterium CP1_7O]OYT76019.1 MAG: glycerol-3-phosphate ABC transporter ATP-binding protein [Armatimonadetes bacterium JP3_11]RMH10273.1 MAG: ABC transporter ATP-binding protein [Armatimonadota bacterium]
MKAESVRFEKVTKRFGSVVAVNRLTLHIQPGEFMVLVGPSGCGKTTALRMLAGLEDPTEGAIYIGDRCVNEVSPRDRDIAMVFQNYALYPHMRVYDNIAFGLRLRELGGALWQLTHWNQARAIKKRIDERVRQVAQMLEIENLLHRLPKELSGGQRQRVALARAIVRQPKAFLMDEPLSNLDAKLRDQTRAELKKLQERLGITTIYVTHDQKEAMTLGTRIAVMKDGVLQQVGSPEAVYFQPANTFVATFIGTPPMNLLDMQVVEQESRPALKIGSTILPVLEAQAQLLKTRVGQTVRMGIRPQDIYTDRTAPPDAILSEPLPAVVDVIEPHGDRNDIHLILDGATLIAQLSARVKANEGDTLPIRLHLEYLHLFDPATGETLRA